jgi:hypothetical protein
MAEAQDQDAGGSAPDPVGERDTLAAATTSEKVAQAEKRLVHLLARPSRSTRKDWFKRDRTVSRDPEVRHVLELIVRFLQAANGLDTPVGISRDDLGTRIEGALDQHDEWLREGSRRPTEAQVWVLANTLQLLLVDVVEEGDVAILAALADLPEETPANDRARVRSALLAQQQNGSQDRARMSMRADYLRKEGWTLAFVVTAFLFALANDWSGYVLAALAGAVGGCLTGARALRSVVSITGIGPHRTWWWVQPFAGAAAGILIYLVLDASIVTLPGTGSGDDSVAQTARVTYAFLAGFSEPFFLGTLARLAGTSKDDEGTNKAAGGAQSK